MSCGYLCVGLVDRFDKTGLKSVLPGTGLTFETGLKTGFKPVLNIFF